MTLYTFQPQISAILHAPILPLLALPIPIFAPYAPATVIPVLTRWTAPPAPMVFTTVAGPVIPAMMDALLVQTLLAVLPAPIDTILKAQLVFSTVVFRTNAMHVTWPITISFAPTVPKDSMLLKDYVPPFVETGFYLTIRCVMTGTPTLEMAVLMNASYKTILTAPLSITRVTQTLATRSAPFLMYRCSTYTRWREKLPIFSQYTFLSNQFINIWHLLTG